MNTSGKKPYVPTPEEVDLHVPATEGPVKRLLARVFKFKMRKEVAEGRTVLAPPTSAPSPEPTVRSWTSEPDVEVTAPTPANVPTVKPPDTLDIQRLILTSQDQLDALTAETPSQDNTLPVTKSAKLRQIRLPDSVRKQRGSDIITPKE